MKQINEKEVIQKKIDQEYWSSAVVQLCEVQLRGLERLLETNQDRIESPLQYNLVAGLINQLKTHIPLIYWKGSKTDSFGCMIDKLPEGMDFNNINHDEWAEFRTWQSFKKAD